MRWIDDYRADIARYAAYAGGRRWRQLLTQQGLWALLQYRVAASIFRSRTAAPVKRALLWTMLPWQKLIEIVTGISLPYTARIGPGLYIGHFGPIVVNGDAVLGSGCNLSQGVTIGVSGRGARRGVPVLGDRVYVGANATVAGPITVGDDAVVGANSLVVADVAPGTTALGVPAVEVGRRGSAEYLDPQGEDP